MRLPSTWKEPEVQAHVDALLKCLSLSYVQHSLVGDPMKPVISGGQRKRVSIGIELAAAPMALFLDEPTSGLDATSSLSVMKLLKALSHLGVTIVTIIHQPRAEIFDCLDNVMLLAEGRQVYRGKTQHARGYFKNLGFHFPNNCNPADTIMDIISGQGYPMPWYEVASVWLGTTLKFLHTYSEAIQAFKYFLQHVILLHIIMQHNLQFELILKNLYRLFFAKIVFIKSFFKDFRTLIF